MKNKAAQEFSKLGIKAQKKKWGKGYNEEMKRRIKVRWDKVQISVRKVGK